MQPDGDPRRFVRFNGCFRDDVLSGRKARTLRYQDPVPLGETTFVFEDGEHRGVETMQGVIYFVSQIRLPELDADYQRSLRSHYR